jgi:Protein of unknown function (DUF1553)/Protein of unknown function (DUF1549)/Concanavalin A-like lectin/glucanases superfamily/Planctomycete cytochrome C
MRIESPIIVSAIFISPFMVPNLLAEDADSGPAQPTLEFARDVLPILSDHCFSCHGPDEASRQAGLRLDLRENALKSNDGVAAIAPGQPTLSELIHRIKATDDDTMMPPPDALKPLSAAQKEILERWIADGAEYAGHWAFSPPKRVDPPTASKSAWSQNTIDRFVLARLEAAGLAPSPQAKRHAWLRRVTLDLTGLPPTIAELDAFVADDSPHAENKVVDRLLMSEEHAERMAMHWLDAARYADTNGYNNDEIRTMWPWRDWVINAFYSGMPYDQFLTEQLAGDLLPSPTISQRVATGFNRNHVLTTEGGIIPEEYQAEYVADRVHTTATVFMGISLQCTRCHDHKFDPFTQRDFYRFAAYFNNIPDKLVSYDSAKMADPVLKVPSPAQQRELAQLNAQQKKLTAELKLRTDSINASVAAWEAELTPESIASMGSLGLTAHFTFDEKDGNTTVNAVDPNGNGLIHGPVSREEGPAGQALKFDGSTWVDAGQTGSFNSDDQFSIAARFRPTAHSGGAVFSKMDDANAFRGYDLNYVNGKMECHVINHWPDKAFKVVTQQSVSLNEWHHVVMCYDGMRQASGVQLFVDGKLQELDTTTNNRLDGPLTTDKPFHIGKRNASLPFHGLIDDVQVFSARLSAAEVEQLARGESLERLAAILGVRPTDRSEHQKEQLKQFYADRIDQHSRRIREQLKQIPGRLEAINKAIPVTMVMQEMTDRRKTHLLVRGQYDDLGDEVFPGLPASLVGETSTPEATRLDMARWLTNPAHPLTARVAVNRWWEMLFGTGLVETAEDFGVQGARPSHPELLDWLATELIRQKWDQRGILKLMVLSATYRQSSNVTPQLLNADPRNRLLSRGSRWRLPAEMVRDNALAVSGLLHRQIGGPSVRPYQPPGLWEDVSVERRDKYVADSGPGLYRRSMYTFWKRTCPPPGMSAFDAPDRETCVVRRSRTNTPLQALVLLNDPTYVEAARAFAERIIHHHADDAERLNFAFRSAVARLPAGAEHAVVNDLLAAARERFKAQPDAANKLLTVGSSKVDTTIEAGEMAAWTSVASIILNLDETISKP